MATVASIDYAARLIYLSAATMNVTLDTMDVYKEVRALRRTVEADRKFKPIIVAGGNVEKIAGLTYTPSYVQLLYGTRIVPYDSSHRITLIRDTFTDDGVAGRDCFDRSGLALGVEVDIDVQVDKIEIVRVATGGNEYTLVQIGDAVASRVYDGSLTLEQSIRLQNSVLGGKVSGAGTGTEVFRDLADTKNRVTVTTDVSGNRTAVARDVS